MKARAASFARPTRPVLVVRGSARHHRSRIGVNVEKGVPMKTVSDEVRAADVMRRRFVTVAPEDTIGEAAEKLARADEGSALVVDYGRLVGILTSRDVLRVLAARVHPSEACVREWMSADPVTAEREMPADEAAHAMLVGGFHHLPVVDQGRPVGVVGLRGVVGALRPLVPGW